MKKEDFGSNGPGTGHIVHGAVLPAGRCAGREILDLRLTKRTAGRQNRWEGNALEGTQEETETVSDGGGLQIETIEEETESDDPAETEAACTETLAGGSGELCACGRASDAAGSERCLYARTVFGMSYGEQLEENAAEIYRQMEESLKKNGCVGLPVPWLSAGFLLYILRLLHPAVWTGGSRAMRNIKMRLSMK